MEKDCRECKVLKSINEFSPNGKTNAGTQLYRNTCKLCVTNSDFHKNRRQQRTSNNIKKRLETRDRCVVCGVILWSTNKIGYCDSHRGQSPVVAAKNKAYIEEHKEHLKQVRKERTTKETHEAYKKQNREWKKQLRQDPFERHKHVQSVMEHEKKYPERKRKFRHAYQKRKLATVQGSLENRMSCFIYGALKQNKNGRKWSDLVGYNAEQLKKHLESRFSKDITWEYVLTEGWEVHHIIPKSLFIYESELDEQFKMCWGLENLIMISKEDNISLDNKLPKEVSEDLLQAHEIAAGNIAKGLIKRPHRDDIIQFLTFINKYIKAGLLGK